MMLVFFDSCSHFCAEVDVGRAWALGFALIASHFDVARLEKSSRIRLLMMAR